MVGGEGASELGEWKLSHIERGHRLYSRSKAESRIGVLRLSWPLEVTAQNVQEVAGAFAEPLSKAPLALRRSVRHPISG